MLGYDERNFHVWNYRHWVVSIAGKCSKKLIKGTLLFTKQKIDENFNNFSALHFRFKYLLTNSLKI